MKFWDTLISLLFSSALRQKSRGAFFYYLYIRARTREGCYLSLKMNEIHKKFALTNGNPGSAPPLARAYCYSTLVLTGELRSACAWGAQSMRGAREAGAAWVRAMAQAQDESNP